MSLRAFFSDMLHRKPRPGLLDRIKQAADDVGRRADSASEQLARIEEAEDPLAALVREARSYQRDNSDRRHNGNGRA